MAGQTTTVIIIIIIIIIINIFHGRNNITCSTDCKNRTAATSRHRFFLDSLCPKANAEMVPKIPSCHYMFLM